VVDGLADVGYEITVCWEMFGVNSRVISDLFSGTVDCFIASWGPDVYVGPGGVWSKRFGWL